MSRITFKDLQIDNKFDKKFINKVFGGAQFIEWHVPTRRHFQLNPRTGVLTFYDGSYGMKPQEGEDIEADYRD